MDNKHLGTFNRFLVASGMTNLADGIATIAWAWLASLLTRDALLIAMVPVALRLPWFVFAIPAGIITDRYDRRTLILTMDVLRALVFLAVAMAIWTSLPLEPASADGVSSIFLMSTLMLAALLVGMAEVLRDNAAQTILPSIVEPQELEQANGRLLSAELVGNALLGPAIGAFLIAAALPLPFVFNGLVFLVAIFLVSTLRGHFRPASQQRSLGWRLEVKEGIDFLRTAPLLKALALLTGFWNLLFHMMMIALVLHVQENLGLDVRCYGLVLAAGALGGIAGGVWGSRIVDRLGPARASQLTLASSAPAFLAIIYAPGVVTLGLVLIFFEFTGIVWNIVSISYRQRAVPTDVLGRVNSLYRLLAWGMMPVGLILSGLLVTVFESFGSREVALTVPFWAAGIGAGVLAIVGWPVLGHGFGRNNADRD